MTDGTKKASHKWDAYEMFGEMRPSTEEELRIHSEMLQRMSHPIMPEKSIFDLLGSDDIDTDPTVPPSQQV